MSEHCIIKADFSATRSIGGRKVLQLIFEVPIEAADDAMARLGGFPQPGENRWCAIALLENNGSANVNGATSPRKTQRPSSVIEAQGGPHGETPLPITVSTAETGTSETSGRDRQPFASLSLTKQAGIRCADPVFQDFLKVETESDAADYLRHYCGVASRSDLPNTTLSRNRWHDLEAKYQSWLTDRKFAEAKR